MLAKELEILRTIEELYHGDTTEQEMLDFAEKNQAKNRSAEKYGNPTKKTGANLWTLLAASRRISRRGGLLGGSG